MKRVDGALGPLIADKTVRAPVINPGQDISLDIFRQGAKVNPLAQAVLIIFIHNDPASKPGVFFRVFGQGQGIPAVENNRVTILKLLVIINIGYLHSNPSIKLLYCMVL